MIINKGDKYQVKDLNSTNGIVVNGKKTKKATLTGNDKIVAGNISFTFLLTNDDFQKNPAKQNIAVCNTPLEFDKKYSKSNSKA